MSFKPWLCHFMSILIPFGFPLFHLVIVVLMVLSRTYINPYFAVFVSWHGKPFGHLFKKCEGVPKRLEEGGGGVGLANWREREPKLRDKVSEREARFRNLEIRRSHVCVALPLSVFENDYTK